MTERDHILETMSGYELDLFVQLGGTLPRRLLVRLNQYRAQQHLGDPCLDPIDERIRHEPRAELAESAEKSAIRSPQSAILQGVAA